MPDTSKHRQSSFDPNLGMFVIPGRPHTLESLVEQAERFRKAKEITRYRICKNSGMNVSQKSADRFFQGYQCPSDTKAVKDSPGPGRVSLETALEILHAMGLDLEVVVRERT
jgi:hypothetical protein